MADFPSYAKVLVDGFKHMRPSAVARTPMEDGMVKQLKTKSRVLVGRPVTIQLNTLADYNSFITWFQTTIDYGAMWFNWTDPIDSVIKLARIVSQIDEEVPIVSTGKWRLTMTIETWSG